MPQPYMGEPEPEAQMIDLHRIVQFARRRWRSIGFTAAAIFVVGFFYVLVAKSTFQATAKIAVEKPPEVMDIGGDVAPADLGLNPDRAMAAVMALTQSDAVLGPVVGDGPYKEEIEPLWSRVLRAVHIRSAKPVLTPDQQRQEQIRLLRLKLKLEREGGGTVLKVGVNSKDPQQAADLANGVAHSLVRYRSEHRGTTAENAAEWLEERAVKLKARIETREKELAALVVKTGIVPRSENRRGKSYETSARPQLAADLQNARIDLYAANSRLAELERRLGRQNRRGEGNARVREQYAKAKAQLDEARLVYTPTHPEVHRLENIVNNLSDQLGPELRGETSAEVTEELKEYRALKGNHARLSARVNVLQRAAEKLSVQESSKSDSVSRYEELERELAVDRQMYSTLLTRLNQTVFSAVTDNNGTRILDLAVAPVNPVSASKLKQLFLVLLFSLLGGFAMAIVRELMDRHVHEIDDAVDVLGAPVLGYIPTVRDSSPAERQSQATNRTIVGEAYRNLRTALLFSVGNSDLSTLVVTSAIAGEGKTTVSSNLTATFAEAGRKVLLVDADLRRPRVNRVFALQRAPGLSEVIQGNCALHEAIERPVGAQFDILTSGSIPENPSELLASDGFEEALERMKEMYDLVLLDCAVMLAVSDALLVAARAQGTLIVQRPGTVEKRALEQMKADLDRGECKVLGIVFNQVDRGNSYVYPSYLESPYVTGSTTSSRFSKKRTGKDAPTRRS